MTQAHDIITRRASRPPQVVAVESLGIEVDEVFHRLIDAIAEKDREIASIAAERAELIDQTREWVERTAHTSVLGVGERRRAERESLIRQVIGEEIACALRVPSSTAESLVTASRALMHELPGTMDALRTGAISYRHAETMIDESWNISGTSDGGDVAAEARQEFEAAALPYAMELTVAKFRQKARKLRERAHPESIEARRQKAATDRAITFTPARDGMAWLNLYLEAPAALAIYNRVTEAAIGLQCPEEERTITQLRADVASDLLLGGGLGSRSRIRPTVMVTVPVLTLLGHSDEPATLDGYGPIDAATARELAGQAPSFTRLLTHPETGAVLSVGKQQYTVPVDMRRWLRVRDGTCRFPGCNRNARFSDIDHTTAWVRDGETRTDNLAHLCPKHHKLKHETTWSVTQGDYGALVWVSPSGHTYVTEPETRMRTGTEAAAFGPQPDDPWNQAAESA